MTPDEIRTVFIDELTRIAPDVEASTLSDEDHLMDDLGLDSMDILNLVTALQDRLGLTVPETDYPRLETLEKAVDYLSRKLG